MDMDTLRGYTSQQVAVLGEPEFVKLVSDCAITFLRLGGMRGLELVTSELLDYEQTAVYKAYMDCVNCCEFAPDHRHHLTVQLVKLANPSFNY